MDKGEFELINIIKSTLTTPEGVVGIGDDCAIIPQSEGKESLISSDMLLEGSHFILDKISAFELGWKAAAVNISDIAAMGGQSEASFLSLALPSYINSEWIEEFMKGYNEVSSLYGCTLLGGDTIYSKDKLCINVTVYGTCPKGRSLRRNGAKTGDKICVTGTLGDSAAGLKLILEEKSCNCPKGYRDFLIKRHYRPIPKIQEAQILAKTMGVHSAIDISDGIASDLRHILAASAKGAIIDTDSIPLSQAFVSCCQLNNWDSLELALAGGEDYELLFTASEDAIIEIPHTVIGHIVKSEGIEWRGGKKDYKGFEHF